MNNDMEKLAQIYGIQINEVQKGEGGLFFTDMEGKTHEIDELDIEENAI